jgi:tRNA (uracil-5-)-methyltransferase
LTLSCQGLSSVSFRIGLNAGAQRCVNSLLDVLNVATLYVGASGHVTFHCVTMADSSALACDTTSSPAPAPMSPMEFTNENLVKFNTFDTYSTPQQAKKNIGKFVPPEEGAVAGTPQSISKALLGLTRAGKNPSTPYLFLTYDTAEHRDAALALILGAVSSRSKPWTMEPISNWDLNVTHKRGKRDREGPASAKAGGGLEEGPSVAPWVNVPYSDQLLRKQEHCKGILKTINKYSAVRDGSLRTGAMLSTVIPSTMLAGYRNNIQLSCGYSKDGLPLCGFNAGQSVEGNVSVIPPHTIPTVHPIAIAVADSFLEKVFEPHKVIFTMYCKATQTGFWRKLHIRHNKESEVMLDIEANPTGFDEGALNVIRAALSAWASEFRAPVLPAEVDPSSEDSAAVATITAKFVSLLFHLYGGTSTAPNDLPREVLYGGPTLDQTLFDLHFDLSAEAFFQVNRPTTELLLRRVVAEAELDASKTVLLDLCCGTGTIGLCLSKHVKRVIGVEMVEAAVENAKVNAIRNGVTNASFVCGRVEHALKGVLDDVLRSDAALLSSTAPDIVAILDPPRCGVHNSVLKWLRNCNAVRRIVYISCDQRALETDCEPLCKPASKNLPGYPFRVCNAFGVDLFPHTPHVEMIVTLRRVSKAELEEIAASAGARHEATAAAAATTVSPVPAIVDSAPPRNGAAEELQSKPTQPAAESALHDVSSASN